MFTPVVRRYARYALEYPYIISNDIFAVNEISRDFTVVKFKIDEFFLFFFFGGGGVGIFLIFKHCPRSPRPNSTLSFRNNCNQSQSLHVN